MYSSNDKSYFSKKRVESGISFVIAQVGMLMYLCYNIHKMSILDFSGWATIEFLVAGYLINRIEKSKLTKQATGSESTIINENNNQM